MERAPRLNPTNVDVIADLPHKEDEVVRIAVKRFRGKAYCDIRIHYDNGNGPAPTRKGISLRMDELHAVRAALGVIIAREEES